MFSNYELVRLANPSKAATLQRLQLQAVADHNCSCPKRCHISRLIIVFIPLPIGVTHLSLSHIIQSLAPGFAFWSGDLCAAYAHSPVLPRVSRAALLACLCAPRSAFCQVCVLYWLSTNGRHTNGLALRGVSCCRCDTVLVHRSSYLRTASVQGRSSVFISCNTKV